MYSCSSYPLLLIFFFRGDTASTESRRGLVLPRILDEVGPVYIMITVTLMFYIVLLQSPMIVDNFILKACAGVEEQSPENILIRGKKSPRLPKKSDEVANHWHALM